MFHLKGLVHKKMVQCPSLPLRFSSRFILRLERRGKQKAAENLLQTHYLVYNSIIKLIIRKVKTVVRQPVALSAGVGFYILDGLNDQLGIEKPHMAKTFEVRRSPG